MAQVTSKVYMCPLCKHTYRTQTNHFGTIYSACPKKHCNSPQMCMEPEAVEYRGASAKMKTSVHTYRYELQVPEQALQYKQFLKAIQEKGYKMFEVAGPLPFQGRITERLNIDNITTVELYCDFAPGGQWNSTEGFRLHDWYQLIFPNKNIKEGYYLDVSYEMKNIASAAGSDFYGSR